jgi:hypothetical protein
MSGWAEAARLLLGSLNGAVASNSERPLRFHVLKIRYQSPPRITMWRLGSKLTRRFMGNTCPLHPPLCPRFVKLHSGYKELEHNNISYY